MSTIIINCPQCGCKHNHGLPSFITSNEDFVEFECENCQASIQADIKINIELYSRPAESQFELYNSHRYDTARHY